MVSGYDILKKLTTRNIISLATVGVFLFAIVYAVEHSSALVSAIETSPPGVVLGGGVLIGTFVAVVKDVYTFFFRKSQTKESTP